MADLETIVLELQADVEDAENKLNSFASDMESAFNELSDTVNAKLGDVEKSLTHTADHATKEGKRAGEGFRTGIEVGIGAIGLSFIMALRRAFDEAMRMSEQFKVLSAISGDSAGQLMRLQYALNQLGIPAENVRTILTTMEAHIGRASIAANTGVGPIHALGLSVKELANKDAITQLEIIADRFGQLGPQAQKAGAQMLFGFRGAVLLPLLQQGSEGIKRLIDAFKPPDPAVWEAFERLNMDLQALHETWMSFSMEMLKPVVDLFIRITEAATGFINKLREMPAATRMEILVSAVAAAALGFETLTTLIGSFLVQSAAVRAVIVILQDFAGAIRVIAITAVIVGAAWATNWGNIRNITMMVFNTLTAQAANFGAMWTWIVALWQVEVIPALDRLGAAVQAIITPIGDTIDGVLKSGSAWDILATVIERVMDVLTAFINVLTWVVQNFRTLAEIILTVIVAVALPSLLASLSALWSSLVTGTINVVMFGVTAVMSFQGAMDAGLGLTGALTAMAGALGLAFPPLLVLQALMVVAGGSAIILGNHLFDVDRKLANLADTFAKVAHAIGDFLTNMATLGGLIPQWIAALNPLQGAILGIGDAWKKAGDAAQGYAQTQRAAADARDRAAALSTQSFSQIIAQGIASGQFPADTDPFTGLPYPKSKVPPIPKTPPGDKSLVPDAPKAKDATTAWLDALKDKMIPVEEEADNATTAFKILEEQIKRLDTIDTPAKYNQALALWAKQVKALSVEYADQGKLAAMIALQLDVVNAKLAKGGLTAQDQHALMQMQLDLTKQYNAAITQQYSIQTQIHDIQQKHFDVAAKMDADVAADTSRNWSERISAAWSEYAIAVERKAKQDEINAAMQKALTLQKDAATSEESLATSAADAAEAKAKYGAAVAGPGATTPGSPGATADLLATFQADLSKSNDALTTLTAAQTYLTSEQNKAGVSSDVMQKAQTDVNTAMKNYYDALTTTTNAQRAYNNSLNYAAINISKELDDLAKQIGGPVYTAFEALASYLRGNTQMAAVNLTQALIQIFEKTQAYKDVEVAMTEIVGALSRILSALRPVVDFLLGVLIGVVNIFIVMYDVVATILDVFGAMITKIKLLNSDLQNMNAQAQPLIKIVHDLPTLGEFNKGYWTQLIGEQDAMNNNLNNLNSDILQGFDKTMSKLGEIVGILIAIKFLLGAFGINLLGSNQNWLQSIAGWWSRIFGGGGGPSMVGPNPIINAGWTPTGAAASTAAAAAAPMTPAQMSAAVTQGIVNAPTAMTDPLLTSDPTLQSISSAQMDAIQSNLDAVSATASNTADTATATVNHAATGISTLGMIGKVAGGIADLYGVFQGYMSGGPMGGVEAGMGAAGLMSMLAPAFAAGPYGIAAAAVIGLGAMLFGGHFGPNPANEPDIYNTSAWGQMNANLWGAGVGQFSNMPMTANGQQFSMNPNLAAATGGMGMLQFIAAFMQSGAGVSVLGPLANVFEGLSTTSTNIISGKNGILDLLNGVQMNFQQLYTDSQSAFQKIQTYLKSAAGGAQEFAGAMNIDLATVYGPHAARAAGGPGGTIPAPGPGPISMTVNFNGDNYGYNSDEVYNQLKPVFNQLLQEYQQQQALYTRSSPFAFSRGLSYS